MVIFLKKENRQHGKNDMGLIRRRMKNGAVALVARVTTRKFTIAIRAAIGIQMMNYRKAGAKSACVKPSTMTHSLSIAKRIRARIILTRSSCATY